MERPLLPYVPPDYWTGLSGLRNFTTDRKRDCARDEDRPRSNVKLKLRQDKIESQKETWISTMVFKQRQR
jgi:hypothetical protein